MVIVDIINTRRALSASFISRYEHDPSTMARLVRMAEQAAVPVRIARVEGGTIQMLVVIDWEPTMFASDGAARGEMHYTTMHVSDPLIYSIEDPQLLLRRL
jgi:hypothetical protein